MNKFVQSHPTDVRLSDVDARPQRQEAGPCWLREWRMRVDAVRLRVLDSAVHCVSVIPQ